MVNLSTHPSSLSVWFTPHTLAPHTPSYAHLRKPWHYLYDNKYPLSYEEPNSIFFGLDGVE